MADNFEKAKDEILRRTAGNGGPDNADILNAMSALAQDGDDQHNESIAETKALRGLLATHCGEAEERDRRISDVEHWQEEWEKACPERMQRAVEVAIAPIKREHERNHPPEPPRRKSDPKEVDYSGDRRVWLMWSIGSRVTNILFAALGAALVLLVNWLVTGSP